MLEHLRQRVMQALADARTATLSTYGPAGLQSSRLPCQALGIDLYILVPRASDHLFNIETRSDVTIVNNTWNLQGSARLLPPVEYPPGLDLMRCPEAGWSDVVRIRLCRITLLQPGSGSPAVTIDVD